MYYTGCVRTGLQPFIHMKTCTQFTFLSTKKEYIESIQVWCLENIGPKHTPEQEGLWMDRCLPEWQYQRYQIRIKEDTHATMFNLKWQS